MTKQEMVYSVLKKFLVENKISDRDATCDDFFQKLGDTLHSMCAIAGWDKED
jgi:hypothetical protein